LCINVLKNFAKATQFKDLLSILVALSSFSLNTICNVYHSQILSSVDFKAEYSQIRNLSYNPSMSVESFTQIGVPQKIKPLVLNTFQTKTKRPFSSFSFGKCFTVVVIDKTLEIFFRSQKSIIKLEKTDDLEVLIVLLTNILNKIKGINDAVKAEKVPKIKKVLVKHRAIEKKVFSKKASLKIHTIVNLPTWYFKLSFFVKVPNFIQIDHFTLTKSSDLIYEFKEKHDEKLRANNLNLKIKLDMLSSYVQRSLSVLNQIIENVKFSLFTISNRFTCKFRKAKLLYVFRVIDGYTFSKRDFKILLRFVNLNFVYTTPKKEKI